MERHFTQDSRDFRGFWVMRFLGLKHGKSYLQFEEEDCKTTKELILDTPRSFRVECLPMFSGLYSENHASRGAAFRMRDVLDSFWNNFGWGGGGRGDIRIPLGGISKIE